MTARGSDEERVVAFLEIMELGGDAPRIATRVDAAEPLSPLTADRLRLRRVIRIRTHFRSEFF